MEPVPPTGGDAALSFVGLTQFLGAAARRAPDTFCSGTRLGDVTIVTVVGQGGMGAVYEAIQDIPRRTVAVKVMRAGVLSAAAARRFEHETQVLGRLNHPGIARIYSAGMAAGPEGAFPYFVMEFVEQARPLTAAAAERDMSLRDRVDLFRQVCQAVAHGHQKGVIHRDLKPGNILVDATGRPKIIDFGVARSTDSDVAMTTLHTDAGQLIGTLQYMAPEQLAGAAADVDVRADVYALGMVLHELLTGRPPYDVSGRHLYEAARIVMETDPSAISATDPQLRGDLATIVGTCLAKERDRRYASATELEADLARYLRGEPIAARRPGLVESLVRLARRHRLAAVATAGVLATLVAGVVGASVFAVQANRERAEAIRARERADAAGREAVEQFYVANLRALRAAIDERNFRLARRTYAQNRALVGESLPLELRLLGARLDEALVVLDMEGRAVDGLAYSPDGGTLGAASFTQSGYDEEGVYSPGLLRLHARFDGTTRRAGELRFFSVDDRLRYAPKPACTDAWVAWWRSASRGRRAASDPIVATSRDASRMARCGEDGRIHVVARAGVDPDVILADRRGDVVTATFNAPGDRIAIQDAAHTLRLWNTRSGDAVVLPGDTDGRVESFQFSPDGGRLGMLVTHRDRSMGLVVHDAASGRRLCTIAQTKTPARSLFQRFAFSVDGSRIVRSAPDNAAEIWDATSGTLAGTLRGHGAEVTAVAFTEDGGQLVSGAANGHIRVWDVARLAGIRDLPGHDAAILTVAFRGDGETFASGSQDGTVRVWSRTQRESLAVLPGLHGLNAVAFSPDGNLLATAPRGTADVELWNPRCVERVRSLRGPGTTVSQVVFSPDGGLVAAASGQAVGGGEVRIWATDTGDLVTTLAGHARGRVSMQFSPDGGRLLTTCGDHTVNVWEARTGRRIAALAVGKKESLVGTNAVFGLDGTRITYTTRDLFDAATGAVAHTGSPLGLVSCQATSPDGRTLATGVAFGSVYLTDWAAGMRRHALDGHTGAVRAITFSPDGSHVATGSLDGTARLWDVVTGACIHTFIGHEGGVETVIVSPDGRRLVTAATDGTVRIWDVARGHELLALPNQTECPTAISLSPDGTCLVAAAPDGTVRAWGLSNADVTRNRQAVTASP